MTSHCAGTEHKKLCYCPSLCPSVTFIGTLITLVGTLQTQIISPIVMWRILRNRRLILRLHTIFRALILLGASRGHLCDSVASCFLFVNKTWYVTFVYSFALTGTIRWLISTYDNPYLFCFSCNELLTTERPMDSVSIRDSIRTHSTQTADSHVPNMSLMVAVISDLAISATHDLQHQRIEPRGGRPRCYVTLETRATSSL